MSVYLVENEIINECLSMAKQYKMENEIQFLIKSDKMLNDQLVGKACFVGSNMQYLLEFTRNIIGVSLGKIPVGYVNRNYEFLFTYGEDNKIMIGTECSGFVECNISEIPDRIKEFNENKTPCVVVSLKEDKLKKFSINVISVQSDELVLKEKILNSDFTVLFTNATSAFNLAEQNFLKLCTKRPVGIVRTAIFVFGFDFLNSNEEIEDVNKRTNEIMLNLNMDEEYLYKDSASLNQYIYMKNLMTIFRN